MTHKTPLQSTPTDLRVQRTLQLIQDALIDLTAQKGFANVTVLDITRQAKINRATFYRHYQDKFDLLDRYAQAVYELLGTGSAEPLEEKEAHSEKAPAGLVKLLEHIQANARFYRVMLGANGSPAFIKKVRQHIENRFRHSLPKALMDDEVFGSLYLNYLSSGSVSAVLWWLEQDMPYSPQEFAALSYRLGAANIRAISKETVGG